MEISEYFPVWDKLSTEQQNRLTGSAIRCRAKKGGIIHGGTEECLGLPVFDSCWKKKSLYPLYLLGCRDFYRCFEL